MTPIEVPSLPLHIDGTTYYKIPATNSTWKSVTKDLQHFTMTTTSREGSLERYALDSAMDHLYAEMRDVHSY